MRILLVTLVLALLAPAAALAVKAPAEHYAALQKQIAAKQIATATVSPAKHTVKVKLKSGRKYALAYTPSRQAALVSSLRSGGAKVHVDKKAKTSGRLRLRYIALIVIVVLALAGGIVYLVQRRRTRSRAARYAPAP
jgi:ATP-dependent Zn protease